MKTYEFWRDRATGEILAIELLDGAVVGSCGPLDHSELDERFLHALEYSPERAGAIEANRSDFELFDPSRPYSAPGGVAQA